MKEAHEGKEKVAHKGKEGSRIDKTEIWIGKEKSTIEKE